MIKFTQVFLASFIDTHEKCIKLINLMWGVFAYISH